MVIKNQDLIKIIGERIRIYRNRRKLSQEKLADKINKSHVYVGRVERGETPIDLDSLISICKELEVSIPLLFENMDVGKVPEKELPKNFYDLALTLDYESQVRLFHILKSVVDYGDVSKNNK